MAGPTIVAKFVADTSKMTNEIDQATSKSGSRVGDFAKKAAMAVGGAFAVGKVVEFGKASVEAAAADAEAQSKLARTIQNVTGATDKQVSANEKWLAALSKSTAIADDDLRPAMDKLVRGFGSVDEAQKALALSTDVAAGTGKDLSTVTDAMMKAAMGNTGALKKMGVEVKNADGSSKSLDQIMRDMSRTFDGQASKSAESAAGKMRGAKIQFGEFQEEIGTAVMPVLVQLADIFTTYVLPALQRIFDFLGEHKGVTIAILGAIAAAFVVWGVNAAIAAAATVAAMWPFLAIGAAVIALAVLIVKNWDTIKAAASAVWQFLQTVWDAIVNAVVVAWHAVYDTITAVWDGIKGAAVATWNFVLGTVQTVWNWIKANWPLLLAIITGPIGIAVLLISRNWDTIKAGAAAVVGFLGSVFGTVVNVLTWPFRMAWLGISQVWEWIKGAARSTYDFMVGVFRGLGDAITAPIRIAWNALASVWNSTVGAVSITIPGWVPGLGGKGFDVPDLPRLASGAVLTRPTLFIGGEAGRELVTPEALLRQILREEGGPGGGDYVLNIYPRTADAADIAYGFRRLELMAGIT